jgi:hypothetical protein
LKEIKLLKFIREMFASLAKAGEPQDAGAWSYFRTPTYNADVQDALWRRYGLRIERRNPGIPTLLPDQFDRDLAMSSQGRNRPPR